MRAVVLKETADFSVGQPGPFILDAANRIVVIDRFNRRLVRFGADGSPDRTFSRAGSGPGELTGPVLLLELDTALVVGDFAQQRLSLLDSRDGHSIRDVKLDGRLNGAGRVGDDVIIAAPFQSAGAALVRWDPRTDSITRLVQLPLVYDVSPRLAGNRLNAVVAPFGDSLVVGFGAFSGIVFADRLGAVWDTVRVPVARRRGVPDDLADRVTRVRSAEEDVRLASDLMSLHLRQDRSIQLVYFDQTYENRVLGAEAFVSVLSADRSKACVDARVPSFGEVRPSVWSRADTLFVLDQRPVDGDLVTIVTGYQLDTKGCTWLPTGERPPGH